MKLNDFRRRMLGYYNARASIRLRSSPGIGKSTIITEGVRHLSQQLGKNLGLVVVNGGSLNVTDALGYLTLQERHERMMSIFTEPFWFTTDEGKHISEYDGGIIFVDEDDKCDLDVKKIIGEAALSRRLGPHVVPEGWVFWFAGNRPEDRAGSGKDLDHLINRVKIINIDGDVDSLIEWANRTNQRPEFKAFVKTNSHIVFGKAPEKQGPFCTPRSLAMAFEDLEEFITPDGKLPVDALAVEDTAGRIGESAAAQLFAMIRLGMEQPEYEDIVKSPETVRVPDKPDAQMLVAYSLAGRVSPADAGQVVKYIERMPKEFAVTFAKAACERNPKLIVAFDDWIERNATLMTVISGAR